MADSSKSLKAEYNFWMMLLSSLGGAISIVSLAQRAFNIGLTPLLQSLVDYYRGLMRPIVDTIRWPIDWIVGLFWSVVPYWFYNLIMLPWRLFVWLWDMVWYYLLFGWLLHWLYPAVYAWWIGFCNWLFNMPPDTYRDMYLLSFILIVPFFRTAAAFDPKAKGDVMAPVYMMIIGVPFAAVGSYWLLGFLAPLIMLAGEDPPGKEGMGVHYLVSLFAMIGAAVAFFVLNGLMG